MARSFKDLVVWQKALELAKEIYKITKQLPPSETYGISSQLRRASVSIPSNIAEGAKRSTKKNFLQFLRIANGSAAELETQILILNDVYPEINSKKASSLLEEVQKILTVMTRL